MKRLIICDTLYQIILAIQMKLTIFNKDEVDIVISDHSTGTKEISSRLNAMGLFHNVQYQENKKILYPNSKIKSLIYMLYYGVFGFASLKVKHYDEIIFYGLDINLYRIYNQYNKEKYKVKWSRFEEGLFSYETDFSFGKTVKMVEKINEMLGKNVISKMIDTYYCFFPEFKKNRYGWGFVQIPTLEKTIDDLRPILQQVFDYKEFNIREKYIYFASSSDIDGRPYGESELVIHLSEILGKDNLIVKKHPRDNRDIYKTKNIHELDGVGIPWEVFQLCTNMEGKVLLTIDSGSFISITATYPQNITGLFLFDLIKCNQETFQNRASNIRNMLNDLHLNGLCTNIKVVESVEEINGY